MTGYTVDCVGEISRLGYPTSKKPGPFNLQDILPRASANQEDTRIDKQYRLSSLEHDHRHLPAQDPSQQLLRGLNLNKLLTTPREAEGFDERCEEQDEHVVKSPRFKMIESRYNLQSSAKVSVPKITKNTIDRLANPIHCHTSTLLALSEESRKKREEEESSSGRIKSQHPEPQSFSKIKRSVITKPKLKPESKDVLMNNRKRTSRKATNTKTKPVSRTKLVARLSKGKAPPALRSSIKHLSIKSQSRSSKQKTSQSAAAAASGGFFLTQADDDDEDDVPESKILNVTKSGNKKTLVTSRRVSHRKQQTRPALVSTTRRKQTGALDRNVSNQAKVMQRSGAKKVSAWNHQRSSARKSGTSAVSRELLNLKKPPRRLHAISGQVPGFSRKEKLSMTPYHSPRSRKSITDAARDRVTGSSSAKATSGNPTNKSQRVKRRLPKLPPAVFNGKLPSLNNKALLQPALGPQRRRRVTSSSTNKIK